MKLGTNRKGNIRRRIPGWVEEIFDLPSMFDDFATRDLFRTSFKNTGVSTPAVNIIETADDFRLEMVAPGMKRENFNVEVEGGVLTITYDHDDNREGVGRDWTYRMHEHNYHSFTRSFSLPETVVPDKIQARYENGILNVIIPKREDTRRKPARQITIT